jgi:TIR domain
VRPTATRGSPGVPLGATNRARRWHEIVSGPARSNVAPLETVGGKRYNRLMKLFLSHTTADGALVEIVKTRLVPFGVVVYVAEHDNKAGDHLPSKVETEIVDSDLVVVLLTARGSSSNFVNQEIGFAHAKGKLVIPIVADDAGHPDLGFLVGAEYINLDPDEPDKAIQHLTDRIGGILQQHHHAEMERHRAELERERAALAVEQQRRLQAEQLNNELMMVGGVLLVVGVIILAMGNQ